MSYALRYSDEAESDLAALSPVLLSFVESHLLRLASQPTALSRPAAFPYPPRCQLYHFSQAEFDEGPHYFTILFRYSQDETVLEILGIGHH